MAINSPRPLKFSNALNRLKFCFKSTEYISTYSFTISKFIWQSNSFNRNMSPPCHEPCFGKVIAKQVHRGLFHAVFFCCSFELPIVSQKYSFVFHTVYRTNNHLVRLLEISDILLELIQVNGKGVEIFAFYFSWILSPSLHYLNRYALV